MIASSHLITVTFFFFFSSRRRHTRCSRDWISDVCSSDLARDRHRDARHDVSVGADVAGVVRSATRDVVEIPAPRSEEHTSELQSRLHLVCRLLLEKKKKQR